MVDWRQRLCSLILGWRGMSPLGWRRTLSWCVRLKGFSLALALEPVSSRRPGHSFTLELPYWKASSRIGHIYCPHSWYPFFGAHLTKQEGSLPPPTCGGMGFDLFVLMHLTSLQTIHSFWSPWREQRALLMGAPLICWRASTLTWTTSVRPGQMWLGRTKWCFIIGLLCSSLTVHNNHHVQA